MDIKNRLGATACKARKGCHLLAGLVLFVAVCPVLVAAESDYMSQLDSEAAVSSDTEVSGAFTQKRREKFEYILKTERPSSFEIYNKLDSDDQEMVVGDYIQKKRLSRSSRLIVDFYFNEK